MSETLKYITEKLTAPPFNRNFNFITFDGLEPGLLLQILSDVLGELDIKHKLDIREESPEQTTMRILEALRIFRFKVPTEPETMTKFCEGLVIGDKFLLYPILEWLLKNFDEMKKRAYLAKYLVKVQIPTEFLQDLEILKLYNEHECLIDKFKEAHKRFESLKSDGFSTTEIKKDITAMQEEKEQILRRISRMKKKLEMFPTSTMMLDVARKLRLEREREAKVSKQIHEQRSLIQQLEQKLSEIRQNSSELRRKATECTPEALLHRLEEEAKVNQYLATDKQPKELEATQLYVDDLAKVVGQPAMTQSFIDNLNQQLREVHSETNRLIEKRMVSADPLEDKASLFRQQANIASNRKEATAGQLAEARDRHATLGQQLQAQRDKLSASLRENQVGINNEDGNATCSTIRVPKAEEFQHYVTDLRNKNLMYKEKRSVLGYLRAEKGILSRTADILRGVDKQSKRALDTTEAAQGMSGYWDTMNQLEKVSEKTASLNQRKGSTLEEMSDLVGRLNQVIMNRRDKLAPLIRELRPLRIKALELSSRHAEKKALYEACVARGESATLRAEQEVRVLREETRVEESRYHYLNAAFHLLQVQQFRLQEEMRGYLTIGAATGDSANNGVNISNAGGTTIKRRSYREMYLKRIADQESLMQTLKEDQKHLAANESSNLRQMKLWRDLVVILEQKILIRKAEEEKIAAGGEYSDAAYFEKDRLLL